MQEQEILDIIYTYYKKGKKTDCTYYDKLLNILIPKENNIYLTDRNLKENSRIFKSAYYIEDNVICLNPTKINEWAKQNITTFKIKDYNKELLELYFCTWAGIHETIHCRQYLIAKNKIESPNEIIEKAYKDVITAITPLHSLNLIKNYVRMFKIILYKLQEYTLILERNAIVDAFEYLKDILIQDESLDEESKSLINYCYYKSLIIGYENSTDGCIKQTYDKLLMKRKYGKIQLEHAYSTMEKFKYGMCINEEDKKELQKLKSIPNKY